MLEKELFELENNPERELKELASLYEKKGLSNATARTVAEELTAHDVFAAHAHIELGLDPNNLTNPNHAAYSSALAFLCGGVVPLITILISPESIRIPVTFITTIIMLFLVGFFSARAGGSNKFSAIARVVAGGILAMIITFGIGKILKVVGV
jgi:VIT1/CCC1 family predicted Fe2+/Mn2+ transporter